MTIQDLIPGRCLTYEYDNSTYLTQLKPDELRGVRAYDVLVISGNDARLIDWNIVDNMNNGDIFNFCIVGESLKEVKEKYPEWFL